MRKSVLKIIGLSAMVGANMALAGDYGTAAEAKAMLNHAVEAMKEDQSKALEMFNEGDDGFKDRDLYPYCGGPDGNFTAHPKLKGKSLKELKDKTGVAFGAEIYAKAHEGEIIEIPYMWPRPGETEPVQKVVFVTKIGDQICAVGYYK